MAEDGNRGRNEEGRRRGGERSAEEQRRGEGGEFRGKNEESKESI